MTWHNLPAEIPIFYEDDSVVLINADCRDILPLLPKVDLVLTDPPYPDQYVDLFRYEDGIIDFLELMKCKQLVFWSSRVAFPLSYTAIHIWDKKVGVGLSYERIFERNGGTGYRVFSHYLINSTVSASLVRDVYVDHPAQKPVHLMLELIDKYSQPSDLILDPFCGSGTTLVAAKQLGRKAIGIEIEEKYCEIAKRRLLEADGITFTSDNTIIKKRRIF